MKRDEIMQAALNAGIMISTQYGQGKNKLMPVSDVDTLVKFSKMVNAPMLEALKAVKAEYDLHLADNERNFKEYTLVEAAITAAEKE